MKLDAIAILTVFLVSLILRFYYVSDFRFAFTIDQARDMLEVRKMVVGRDPVFIGPTTSLNGVFLGPFWFYLNTIPFILGGGDPTALVFFQIILIHLGIGVFWFYFRLKDRRLAFWGTVFLLVSPRLFQAGTYSFNANTTPVFVLLSLLFLHYTLQSPTTLKTSFLGLLAGLTLQLEAAFGLLIFPVCCFWLFIKRCPVWPFIGGFAVTLLPQLLFELRHQFVMTKTLFTEFTGGSTILGDQLSLVAKLSDRLTHYANASGGSFSLPYMPLLFFVAIFFILFFPKNFNQHLITFSKINLSLLILSFFFYLLYPFRLKDWWSINFVIPYLLIGSLAASRLPTKILLIGFIYLSFPLFLSAYRYRQNERSPDPALLLNQTQAIDTIYQDASGRGFQVYVFTPPVYDYHYQYLFWWYGQKKYGYLPATLTYQDGVPPYVENNDFYWQNYRVGQTKYLVVESGENWKTRELAWRRNFGSCSQRLATITNGIIVEKLVSCK